jgi:alpha-beta hydrolase superfamily lysophospholipase
MLAAPSETIDIATADGFAVRGDLYLPAGKPPMGIVVLCHGFKGYRNWGFLPFLAAQLASADIGAYSIDFSFNGTVDGTVVRPDLFGRNTLGRECEDLALVLRFVRENGLGRRIGKDAPLGLFGHSRGGVSAFVNAFGDDSVRALCTWAAPDDPDHFTARQKARWRERGEFDFADTRDGTRLALSSRYLDDLELNHDLYDLCRRAADLRVPHLIVHGSADIVVHVGRARSLHEAERGLRERKIMILATGHTFGVTGSPGQAMDERPRPLAEACDATVDWFRTYLRKGV